MKKPNLSFWQIWNLSFGFLGVQIGYALQNANTSRILQSLGADVHELSYFWLAAPIAGLIVQPIVGLFSDRTWTPLGRRIPFILGGSFLATLALFLMPNAPFFVMLMPALAFAAIMLLFMDMAFNVTMQPFRALVADMLNDEQKTKGYAVQTFLMVASFINPHDICDYHVLIKPEDDKERIQKLPRMNATMNYIKEVTSRYSEQELYSNVLPPLAPNHGITVDAPESVIPGPKTKYTSEHWQMHKWIYGKLTEDVDSDMAPIINVLRKNGMLENTIVVFVSDHGEQQGAHCREMKMAPYQESQLVPFVFAGCRIKKGIIDSTNPVNSGIDLLPTLCDLAGITIPDCMPGHSLKPLLEGKVQNLDRQDLFLEGANWFQIVRSGRYKYTIFESKNYPDMLIDLQSDPGEMQNLSNNPEYKALRDELNDALMLQLQQRGIVLRDNVRRPTI